MRVMTILGTRPEIIRLSVAIPIFDRLCDHVVLHTGQNYDEKLSDVFFKELGLRPPDEYLGVRARGFAGQAAEILARVDDSLERHRPDRVLILGDTNSGLSAIVAARRGVPVYHLEAGNRCFDDRVPEEVNRRIIDHCSTVLMPYTHRSKENLLREGIAADRIFVVGNPISEVIQAFAERIEGSDVLARLDVEKANYFLVTLHRMENVAARERLALLLGGLEGVAARYGAPVIVSLHPHTADRIRAHGLGVQSDLIRLCPPFGLFDFVALERAARCVITDSGTVQEEGCIFGVPNVTIRDVTERPETIECGSNILSGGSPRSFEMKRSNSIPERSGFTSVMPSAKQTVELAAEPRPWHKILTLRAKQTMSYTVRK